MKDTQPERKTIMSNSEPTATDDGLIPLPCSHLPNPGSKQAQDIGCLCPVLDNAHGKGYMCIEGVFVYREDCPIHCAKSIAMAPATLEPESTSDFMAG